MKMQRSKFHCLFACTLAMHSFFQRRGLQYGPDGHPQLEVDTVYQALSTRSMFELLEKYRFSNGLLLLIVKEVSMRSVVRVNF
jgi:hypothetical protein